MNRKLLGRLGLVLPSIGALLIVASFLVGGSALLVVGAVVGGTGIALQALYRKPGGA